LNDIEFLIALLAAAAVLVRLADALAIPYPIVLVIGGLLLSFIPGIPKVTLDPDLVFFVILPPLLYSAAWLTSWREFSYNLVSIFLLAFGLVTFTRMPWRKIRPSRVSRGAGACARAVRSARVRTPR